MTHPMPEPPECAPDGSPHESVPYNGGDFLRCHRHDPTRRYRKSKRLTDAECKAEFHAAHAEHLQVIIDNIGESVTAGTYAPTLNRLAVMERFATHPHALEVQE